MEIMLEWKNVNVMYKQKRSVFDIINRRESKLKRIITNASGQLESGDFAILLGPSGAGKTTLMVTLSGKSNLDTTGVITINGGTIDVADRQVELIPQKDQFVDTITAYEHLYFMIQMRMNRRVSKSEKRVKLMRIIHQLDLEDCCNTMLKSLSGGQRKIISMASALISEPNIILCDEPTTGLDSISAGIILDTLRNLALDGKIVVCSVHQPSSELFYRFNKVMLLTSGYLVYCGDVSGCRETFQRYNLKCPKHFNEAEFYINNITFEDPDNMRQTVLDIKSDYEKQLPLGNTLYTNDRRTTRKSISGYPVGWYTQFNLLVWRMMCSTSRDYTNVLIHNSVRFISSILYGIVYYNISSTGIAGVQNMKGLLWLICADTAFGTSYAGIASFMPELMVYRRESYIYSSSAFFFAEFIFLIPRCIIKPTLIVLLSTWSVTMPSIRCVINIIGSCILLSITSTSYGLGLVSIFDVAGILNEMASSIDFLFILLSGGFQTLNSLSPWFAWMKYTSHFYYGFESVSNVYWSEIKHIDCPLNMTSCVTNGLDVLEQNGLQTNYILDVIGFGFCNMFWFLISFIGLMIVKRSGYVH